MTFLTATDATGNLGNRSPPDSVGTRQKESVTFVLAAARLFIPAEWVTARTLLQRQPLSPVASEPDGLHYGLLWQFER